MESASTVDFHRPCCNGSHPVSHWLSLEGFTSNRDGRLLMKSINPPPHDRVAQNQVMMHVIASNAQRSEQPRIRCPPVPEPIPGSGLRERNVGEG